MVSPQTFRKYQALRAFFQNLPSCVIAFSGGVDSSFLLAVAFSVLKEKVLAVTLGSPFFPLSERQEAVCFCKQRGIRHLILEVDLLEEPEIVENGQDRCYFCKKRLFTELRFLAAEGRIETICEGTNCDDLQDFRPGLKALEELKIQSPLSNCGLSKEEIRELSRMLDLPTYDKSSFACLATRIPYGQGITQDVLTKIERSEFFLQSLGVSQFRVRSHGTDLARIEVPTEEFSKVTENREKIIQNLAKFGFTYVTLDLKGYRTGSMNEVLK